MKIVLLVDFLPSNVTPAGGLQNYVLRIAQTLSSLGEEVWVLCQSKDLMDHYEFPVRNIPVSYKEKRLVQIIQFITLHKIDNSLTLLLNAWATRRECKKIQNVDLIQSPNYKFMGLFVDHKKTSLVVRASSYRPVWTEEVEPSPDTKLNLWLEKKLFKCADHIYAPSQHLADMLQTILNEPVDVLPSPIPDINIIDDESWYSENLAGKKYILYFGTIMRRKGLFILAEAMKLVWEKQPEVILVLTGPDLIVKQKSNYQRFNEIISHNQDKVIYTSNLNHEKLFTVIRNSFFTVSPSIEDNCPNSMLEAMALGKVVLGTIGSSMDEFYPELCKQLLVPKGDANALAEKILWLWKMPQAEIDLLGMQSKLFVETNHNPTRCAKELITYYHDLLA
jgi:glycosyltransferase involved in cell wall biosynthesis